MRRIRSGSSLSGKRKSNKNCGLEHGVTFAASTEDAIALAPAVAGAIENATVQGNALVLRSVLGYKAASTSIGSPQAFEQATKFLVGNMLRSITKKLEIELLYGQVGYGVVDSVSSNTLVIKAAEWAPGIWAGAEKMPINIRTAAGVTRGDAVITKVDFATRSITVDSMPASVADTDVIYHKGAYGKEFVGIHKMLTTSGTLFGIDNTEYALFKGNEYDAGNNELTFEKVQEAVEKAVEKGLEEAVVLLVNPKAWTGLMKDQSALRMFDSSYSSSKATNGSKEIEFFSQNGVIKVIPSLYVKQGYAYVLCLEDMVRIGSSEVTFKRPGKGDEFFMDAPDLMGYELRSYCDMALFCPTPAKNVLIKNIAVA